ncbi:hypothetical protein GP486_008777, partial [Trichoglossum hirsutum]
MSKVEAGLITPVVIGGAKYLQTKYATRQLKKRFKEDPYTPPEVKKRAANKRAVYVRPDCQDNNPVNTEFDPSRRGIFHELDLIIGEPILSRLTFILADTGMGKSTFLDRYYAYHWGSLTRSKKFRLVSVPLPGLDIDAFVSRFDADAIIETVILFDSLDEDPLASENFSRRLEEIVGVAGKFRAVVVTCRTQFLTDASVVPDQIDLQNVTGPMGLSYPADQK